MSKEKTTEEKLNPEHFTLKEENKDNFKKAVIARSNLTNLFTLEDVEAQQANLEKMQRELEGQIKVSSAVVVNVEKNHPEVAKLSDEKLAAADYLFENKKLLADSETKLKEVVRVSKHYEDVLVLIYEKFGFVVAGDTVIEEPNDEATA